MEWNVQEVSYVRPELSNVLHLMRKVRDTVAGESAVKASAEVYLPRLPGHTIDDSGNLSYSIYLRYAHFYPATSRTASGLRGLVFRKDPVISIPPALEMYRENITADGQSLVSFSKDVLLEVIQTNRCGLFVDFPSMENNKQYSRADMDTFNIRPYVRMYKAETIINWRTRVVNNQTVTSLVVLREDLEVPDTGGFKFKLIPQYRVLYLDETGKYNQDIYQDLDTNVLLKTVGGLTRIDHITPLVNNKPLDYIPFYPITDKGITWDLTNATLLPLAETNLSHYLNSANRENALIWTGNPTPVFSGYAGNPDEGAIRLGSCEAILVQNGGSASFLEFTGQGINPIKDAMLEKEEEMAILGARIVSPEKRTAETAESAAIHKAGEQGVLADIANSISDGLTKIMRFFALYHGVKDLKSVSIQLNTDYMPIEMTSDMVSRIGELYQHRLLSWESYIYILQKGELLDTAVTADSEYARIVADKKRDNIPEEESKTLNRTSSLSGTAVKADTIEVEKPETADKVDKTTTKSRT